MTEFYVVNLDGQIQTEQQLYAAFTDTIFLGESGIQSWDQFYDLLYYRLDGSDIQVRVEIADDFSSWPEGAKHVADLQEALEEECPDKLIFIRPHQ